MRAIDGVESISGAVEFVLRRASSGHCCYFKSLNVLYFPFRQTTLKGRNVKSDSTTDANERRKDFLSECELTALLKAMKQGGTAPAIICWP
jgi:hypothetical protein